jgi:hypothetical protein
VTASCLNKSGLGCDAVYSGISLSIFRENLLSSSSRSRSKPSKQRATVEQKTEGNMGKFLPDCTASHTRKQYPHIKGKGKFVPVLN